MIKKYDMLDLDLYMALLLELRNFRKSVSIYQITEKLKIVPSSESKRKYFVNSLVDKGIIFEKDGLYIIDQSRLFFDFLNSPLGKKFESVIHDNSIILPWYKGKTF
ncbi:MAG: hypothetical protein QME12_07360 [Nanoarchaeota archaeon]|nr:hypothetical protein [Nanoarchaeota archaeon]